MALFELEIYFILMAKENLLDNRYLPNSIPRSVMPIAKKMMLFSFLSVFLFLPGTAQKKNVLSLKGLNATVEVLRDEWGVNHIYAQNQHDLFFAQGYCAAKDRLFQFEVWRRQATGTVAEILGARELKRDIGTRLFKYRGDLKTELNHYHPQGEAIINAYTDGVNSYVAEVLSHPELLPIEFKLLKILPGKWTPEVVISRHQGLLGNITEELSIGKADSAINQKLLNDNILDLYNAYRKEIVFEAGDINKAEEDPDAVMNLLNQSIPNSYQPAFEHGIEGSNNWIVSGNRTASGHAMLANDPHRKIAVPSLRYMVHLVAPGWNVIGAGVPEIPGVSIGHNQVGAWGLTIYETDGEDLYVYDLNPKNLSQYFYKGHWETMKTIQEKILVKNSMPELVTLSYTIHGPVTYIDSIQHKAYAVKCAWLEPGGAPYMASLRIDQAKSWESFRDACSYSHIPGENMIWADTAGNIGWQTVGIIPIRKNFSGLVPVPGDGRYEWQGYLPIKERPHQLNPAKGFLATANQNVTADDYKHWDAVGYTWADPFRGNRINEVLSKDDKMTIAKMQALQTDYYSLPARSLVPMLLPLTFNTPLAQQSILQLKNWNEVLDKQSIAASIYAMWERQLMKQAAKQFIPENIKDLVSIQLSKLIGWLEKPDSKFGTDPIKGRDTFLKISFENAIAELENKLGNNINNWQYGQEKFKHTSITHPLNSIVNKTLRDQLNLGPLPRGGNSHTPGSTGGADNQLSGASFRFIADTGNWDDAVMINTPGQSGDYKSEFYRNLFPLWANDQYFPAYYSKDKILKTLQEKTTLNPIKK
jgi:penicillin amidase